jgi:hypothetical protein
MTPIFEEKSLVSKNEKFIMQLLQHEEIFKLQIMEIRPKKANFQKILFQNILKLKVTSK